MRQDVWLGAPTQPISSTDAAELIIIPYVTRHNDFSVTEWFAILYLMTLPEYAHASCALGFIITPLYKLTYTWKSPYTINPPTGNINGFIYQKLKRRPNKHDPNSIVTTDRSFIRGAVRHGSKYLIHKYQNT